MHLKLRILSMKFAMENIFINDLASGGLNQNYFDIVIIQYILNILRSFLGHKKEFMAVISLYLFTLYARFDVLL